MKVTSTKTADFPKLGWSIQKDEVKELPESKEAQEQIISRPYITEVVERPLSGNNNNANKVRNN